VKKKSFSDYLWNFVWSGVRCDASNRLLRNSSRDLLGGFRVASRVMSCDEFYTLIENTCSEYRIPPQNTPEWEKYNLKSIYERSN